MTTQRTQAEKLVDLILATGASVTVNYGDDNSNAIKTRDRSAILPELWACDEEWIIAHDKDGKRIGWFFLVWGNAEDGSELVADHLANPYCEKICNEWSIG